MVATPPDTPPTASRGECPSSAWLDPERRWPQRESFFVFVFVFVFFWVGGKGGKGGWLDGERGWFFVGGGERGIATKCKDVLSGGWGAATRCC
jgi:hypothetical protein